MFRIVCVAALAAASQALAAPPQPPPPALAVSIAGVDFRDPGQVRRLYAEIGKAAEAVCRADAHDLRVTTADPSCVAKAIARTVKAADRPLLTAMHECGCTDRRAVMFATRD